MNIYASLFLTISNYERDVNNENALIYFKKAIDFNTNNLEINQIEIDDLISKYENKSIEINKALLSANHFLLRENPNSKEVMIFLVEKYFKLDGLAELFLESIKN